MTARASRNAAIAFAAALVAVVAIALAASPGEAIVLAYRTMVVSEPPRGGVGNGASQNPVLSTTGRVVAFDTTATNLGVPDANGPVRDVFAVDRVTDERRLVSAPTGGSGADGPSSTPVISRDGQRVVFVSQATNLVAADTNGHPDIFFRDGRGPIGTVSVGLRGVPANGPSGQPDISADGRFVVFASAASNLVEGDTNGHVDVFVRDLLQGFTFRASVSSRGVEADGNSFAPAIAADARAISFASAATNLVEGDTNRVPDVFVRVPSTRRTDRVSVSSSERQQNRAVAAPFTQVSDLSRDGRYVVFESDATNLVRPDANRRTDIFRRDRRSGRTTLVSVDSYGFQGNNDSFAPTITPSGQFISFQSFATNLAPGGGPREDIFVRDLSNRTTSVVNVPATGGRRSRELVQQLLQRPSLSNNGTVAAFTSTARNLVDGDTNDTQDVFVRLMHPPRGRATRAASSGRRPTLYVDADDPRATSFVCQVGALSPFPCRSGAVRLPAGVPAGSHLVKVRAGGPGMLYDPDPVRIRVRVTRRR